MRALPGCLPGLGHRKAAQPEDLHHGHPRHGGRRRGGRPADPEQPFGAGDVWPDGRRPAGAPCPSDRRHRHSLRCGLGLRDLWRMRRGLPGAHRARRQDRGTASQPRPRRESLSAGNGRRDAEHGGCRQPVGPAPLDPNRLDTRPALRGANSRLACGRRPARRNRGALLGRLCGRLRRAQSAGRPGIRDVPQRGRCALRHPRSGGVVHRRSGSTHGQRLRLSDPRIGQRRNAEPLRHERAHDRDRMPALLQRHRQRIWPVGWFVRGRSSLRIPGSIADLRPAADR